MVTGDRRYLVHVVCNLHDSLLGEAQVEVLVPELRKGGDGGRSAEQEQGREQSRLLFFLQGTTFLAPVALTSVLSATMKSSMYFMVLQASLFACKADSKAWRSEGVGSPGGSWAPQTPQSLPGWTAGRGNEANLGCYSTTSPCPPLSHPTQRNTNPTPHPRLSLGSPAQTETP